MLTDDLVKGLQPKPDKHQWIETDHKSGDNPAETCRGFGVKVMRSGTKTFVVSYRIDGREREHIIGPTADWKCAAARKRAGEIRKLAKDGEDPQAERVAARDAPTVKMLAARYLEEHAVRKRPRGKIEDESLMNQWIIPEFGSLKVAAVEFADIDRLHRKITKGGKGHKATPVRANRVITLLSKMFNLAIRWKMRADNPVKGVERNHEDPRERYLDEDEIDRLTVALNLHPNQQAANLIRLLLYTGARRGETMRATWSQFDLDKGIWSKPSSHTKTERRHRVPLAEPAVQLLTTMRKEAERQVREYNENRTLGHPKREPSPYLFPGRGIDGPMVEIKSAWSAIVKDARLEGVRVHDLRHSVASILINKGLGLPVIGQLLGHTQAQTTRRYAHLADKPLREAAEQVAKVINLRKA